jgi:Caspase domain
LCTPLWWLILLRRLLAVLSRVEGDNAMQTRGEFSFLHFVMLGLALGAMPLCAKAEPDCAAEDATLQGLSTGVAIDVRAPKSLIAGGAIEISWQAKERAPLKTPLFVVVAVPGQVRFEAQSPPTNPKGAADGSSSDPQPPELPGFVALTPNANGPLGLKFGAGQSRALIPLHQPGSKLAGTLAVRLYEAGERRIEAAVVAHTACGERMMSTPLGQAVTVAPGQPEIVVQDPFDTETPSRILVSNSGHYRANIFEDRYKIYDTETGAKLVDRAGHDPNFSPTSRFVVANVGARDSDKYEVIDLVSGDTIATPSGSYIGWTHSDSFLVTGGGSWGALSVRPALISPPPEPRQSETLVTDTAPEGPGDPPDYGFRLDHPGSCHACASWSDDNLMLDLDNGILAFTGKFEADASPVFELATGASLCCKGSAQDQQEFIDRTYATVPFRMELGWHAREPIRFSQIYDPLSDPNAKEMADQDWFKAAMPLRSQLFVHKTIDPKTPTMEVATASINTVVRGDWRTKVANLDVKSPAAATRSRLLAELSHLGLNAAEPAAREAIPFVNSWAGEDRKGRFRDAAADKRNDAMIEQRTLKLQARLAREIPTVAPHLAKKAAFAPSKENTYLSPLEGLAKGKIYLIDTLEGLWRWEIAEHPVWFLQLWATEGNGGIGEGVMFLFEGDGKGEPRKAGRIVDLTNPLQNFWAGAYGATDHQTQLKPQLYLDRYLVAASVAGKTIATYDIKTDKVLAIIRDVPQADLIEDVVLTSDAAHVIQINSDGQFFIHELVSGRVVLSGRLVDDEIIAYTPEGYYWSSYEGAHFVQLRFPGLPGLYPFQQFASVLNRPDIVTAQLHSGATTPPSPKLVPPPTLDLTLANGGIDDRDVHFDVLSRSSVPLARLRVYADGHLIEDTALSGLDISRRIDVPRSPNARWLTAQVTDASGLVSKPQAVRLSAQGKPTSVLYGVLVGINTYSNPKMQLSFARSDAERLGAALRANAGHYYSHSETLMLLDGDGSKDAILSALRQTVSAATADDTIVFSFAGHGAQDQNGHYFVTPADFDGTRPAETGLAWSDVAALLRGAKSRVIIVLDACHAGLSGVEGLGTNDDAVNALLSGAHPPMLVLAASKGRQFSYEGPKWGGGVFTDALVEAIQRNRQSYDLDHNGVIETSELYYALKSLVVRETGGEQTPWLVRQDLLGDFALF